MIRATVQGFRPYVLENNREVGRIILYGNGQVYQTIERGWLEHVPLEHGKPISHSLDVQWIVADEPVRANKVNLDRTDNYYHFDKSLQRQFIGGKHYTLYIHLDKAPHPLGEFLDYESETSKCFKSYVVVSLACQVERCGALADVILATATRIERTDFGRTVDEWTERLKNDDIDISSYSLQRLLLKYNLTLKE